MTTLRPAVLALALCLASNVFAAAPPAKPKSMHLMTHDAFQQEREAAGKWVRAQLTSAQLPTYFVGVQEQFDLRKAMEARLGSKFDLKAYHDQVLSYGAPPVRFVRELMLDEPIR